MYTGQDAIITADINRMSLIAYHSMANCAIPSSAAPFVFTGTDGPGGVGTILATEGQMFPLCLVFPYSVKPAYSNATNGPLPAAYVFPLATLESPDDIDPGTQDLTIHMVWHAIRSETPNTTNNISLFNQVLYTNALPAGLPAPT